MANISPEPFLRSNLPFFFPSVKYLLGIDEREAGQHIGKNPDQNAEQMRSEGKRARIWRWEMAPRVHVRVHTPRVHRHTQCVRVRVTSWFGKSASVPP